jgi:hypothetical protein
MKPRVLTDLVTRENQGIRDNNILSTAGRKDNDFSNVVGGERLAATTS